MVSGPVRALTGGFLIITAAFAGTVWRLKLTGMPEFQDIAPPD